MFWLLSLTGVIPPLVAMAYVDWLDRKRPEPPATLRRVAVFAALLAIPCVVVEAVLLRASAHMMPLAKSLFDGFIVAALVEEGAKILAVRRVAWNRPEFDERMDGIVYGARAGLGFALIENVAYLVGATTLKGFLFMFVLRGVFSVPMHAIAGGLSGYFGAKKRFDGTGIGFRGGFCVAVLLHGTFDACLFAAQALYRSYPAAAATLSLLGLFSVVPFAVWLKRLAKTALADDDQDSERAPRMK